MDEDEKMQEGQLECNYADSPRDSDTIHQLQNRLNRVIGQLNGIKRMVDDNRNCRDILIQVSAAKKALEGAGFMILEDYMNSYVSEEIKKGNETVASETIEIMKNLK